jgi:hypothetical protein
LSLREHVIITRRRKMIRIWSIYEREKEGRKGRDR